MIEETAMHTSSIPTRASRGKLVQVKTPADIMYLVKQSKVIIGRPGRKFVIFGAERLAYRVQWHPNGYRVQRLDKADNPIGTMTMLPEHFDAHGLGEALRRGQLFTAPVRL
jgi:hypothetical protein